MDKSFLLKEVSKPIGKTAVVSLAAKCANSIPELIKLCLHSNYEMAFRAAWILEMVATAQQEQFKEHLNEFIEAYAVLKNQSCQRHFTKILMSVTNGQSHNERLSGSDIEGIIETTFGWMIDPQTPVAVRVNCMDILYNLKDTDDWIGGELCAQIEFQLANGTAALQSRGKKILAKLYKGRRKSQ
jgi:hypothetical protein